MHVTQVQMPTACLCKPIIINLTPCSTQGDAIEKCKRRMSHVEFQNQMRQFHPIQAAAGLRWALRPLLQRQVPGYSLENVLREGVAT